jgi:hypothetical protein
VATRTEYNQCMRPYITGSKPKEQRKLDFCVGAKICSGKASSRDEAIQICSLPKVPKPANNKVNRKTKVDSCEKEASKLTQCMMRYFDDNDLYQKILNINSVEIAIENALLECTCQK